MCERGLLCFTKTCDDHDGSKHFISTTAGAEAIIYTDLNDIVLNSSLEQPVEILRILLKAEMLFPLGW